MFMKKKPTISTIKRRAFYESDDCISGQLIVTVTVECNQIDKDYRRNIKNCANFLKEAIYNIRVEFPQFTIDEWYVIAVLCYLRGSLEPIQEIKNLETKTWIEFKSRNIETSSEAEKIYLKSKRGIK